MNVAPTAIDNDQHTLNDHEHSENEDSIESDNEEAIENGPTQSTHSSDVDDTFNVSNVQSSNDSSLDDNLSNNAIANVGTTIVDEQNDFESDVRNDTEADALQQDTSNDEDSTSGELQRNDGIDVKHGLGTVDINAEDENAINDLLLREEEADENNEQANANRIAAISLGCNEKAEMEDGKIIVTKILDNSLEMKYTYGEELKPRDPLYTIKMNDVISGNLPFKENVNTAENTLLSHNNINSSISFCIDFEYFT